ncbi:antibiotic biosynthesis monooxygenase [Caballeronia arationis]|jgi:quinol monooxygenase YgiN|uniref:Quinol monooxygenase YgiN n=1 Tax=Caballeronia arationis TaxID=1777142 RepID=A0A7Z7I9J0_9BURK|nr:putative quinol monooxygenase [Caballeronia arationis]SAK74655.1 antibiotic biosynthesis monooxygenase [Caballeronia arationis]SOE81412.1 Quinol monooxygenase YgiN [Caballeronia arationis]
MSEIAVVATFVAKPGQEEKLKEALQGLVEPTLKERGALQYDLHRDLKEPRRFVFFERWTSEAALEEHGRSPHIQAHRLNAPALVEHGEIHVVAKL